MKSLEGSGAPAREFWESDLEMALDHILEQSGQDGFIDEWIGRRTGSGLANDEHGIAESTGAN